MPGLRGPVNLKPSFLFFWVYYLGMWMSLWMPHVFLKQSWEQKWEGSRSIFLQVGQIMVAGLPQPGVQHLFSEASIKLKY